MSLIVRTAIAAQMKAPPALVPHLPSWPTVDGTADRNKIGV